MAAKGVNRGASRVLALFIDSLRLVLMGISRVNIGHYLTLCNRRGESNITEG